MTPVEGGNDRSLLAARIASLSIAMVGNAWGIGMGIEIDRAARSRPVVFHGIVFCHDQLDFGPLARSESECGDIRTGLRRVTCRTVRVDRKTNRLTPANHAHHVCRLRLEIPTTHLSYIY